MHRLLLGFAVYTFVGLGVGLSVPGEAAAAVHRVGKGESLSRISRNNGCTIAQIQSANDLGRKTVIYPGQRLVIPACDEGTAKKKTKEKTKKKTKKTKEKKKKVPRFVHHRVSKGESLSRIAKRYGCTPAEIRARNRIRGNMIYPGMDLVVPSARAKALAVELKKGQSVGKPHRGSLHEGVQLPFDRAYYRRRTARAYGASHTVAYLRQAIASVRSRYPKVHRLAIGDLSHSEGGALPGHRSHQSGRDVDVGLYYKTKRRPAGYPKEFAAGTAKNLDLAATWTLIDALLATRKLAGGVEHIFLDYTLQGLLYKYAKKHGAKRKLLSEVFQYPHGRGHGGTLIQHVAAHDDHLHIRYKCPKGDRGCK